MKNGPNREGFSLVELVISLLVIGVAVLALAIALGYTALQLRSADTRTERSVAIEELQERLRSMDFDDITTTSPSEADTIGRYTLWWEVRSQTSTIKRITIISEGPGLGATGLDPVMRDSASITLANYRSP